MFRGIEDMITMTPSLVSFHLLPQILKRGCNVNDRDGLTDMTLLHYTCKSGAHGIGEYHWPGWGAQLTISQVGEESVWSTQNFVPSPGEVFISVITSPYFL